MQITQNTGLTVLQLFRYRMQKLYNYVGTHFCKYKYNIQKDEVQILPLTKTQIPLLNIITGNFNSGIKDTRLKALSTEYRAYNYEGYDDVLPNNYICIDKNGDRRLKPHIYLEYVEVKPEFVRQGVYSSVIKQLITASKNEDCEGRIILYSLKKTNSDSSGISNPSVVHWKCGFRFVDSKKNEIMRRVINGQLPLEDMPSGTMYMPCA